MRILYIGAWLAYKRDFYNDTASPIGRDQEIPRALAQRGHQVDLLAAPGSDVELPGPVRTVSANALDVTPYDAVVCVPEFTYWTVREKTSQVEALRKHPNVIAVCDQWLRADDDIDFARVYMTSSARSAAVYSGRYPDRVHVSLPWAITDFPRYPNPWADERPRAVFCGYVGARDLALVNAIAAHVDVWIAGSYTRADGIYSGFSDEARAKLFRPNVYFMTDAPSVRAAYDRLDHGPLRYGQQIPFYQHATVGLCFARENTRRACVTSKLYDHLGEGLLTVVEEHTANAGDVIMLDAGTIVPYGDTLAFVNAVLAQIRRGPNDIDDVTGNWISRRERIRREARVVLGTWTERARLIEAYAKG